MRAFPELARRAGSAVWRHPFILLFVLLAGAAAAVALWIASVVPGAPTIADIRTVRSRQPTVLLSADGQTLAVFRRTNREWVKLSEVAQPVVDALLATEDQRFFEHRGLDLRRTFSAAWHTMRGDLQGGSTISQQLARNMFPDEIGRAPTLERKVREAVTALRIESIYSKNEILEMYLNTVPFLYNAYGIEMAARTYFDKSASELDTLQAATLVGMLKGTSYYNPVLNPERAVQRRNIVLGQLVKWGKLPAADYDRLKKRPLGLNFEKQEEDLGPAPHVAAQVRRWLIAWADRHGYNIYADGLVVRTTIDSRLQAMATEALTRQADKLQQVASKVYAKPTRNRKLLDVIVRETPAYRGEREGGLDDAAALKKLESDTAFVDGLWKDKTQLQAAFVAEDPSTGHIKAWVGSRDFKDDQFDHVQQARRQPGSTFKPFVYGAAFDMGVSPLELYMDQPVEIRIDANTVWRPGDVHEVSYQPTTLRDGLVFSKNSITAQLVQRVGAPRVAQLARAMGVRQSPLDEVPSLALGTSPVTLKEMVSAYSSIADDGHYIEPVLVLSVSNRKGEVLEDFGHPVSEQALSRAADQVLLDVMRGVVDRGTGAAIRTRFGLQGDLAGKTGTTQDNTDGWFILMHPQLVAGAWVGFNDARIVMGDSWGQGARNALLVVGDFFQQATRAKAVDTRLKFAAPHDTSQPDPDAIERMQQWWNSTQQPQGDPGAAAPGNGGEPVVIMPGAEASATTPQPPQGGVAAVPYPPSYPAYPTYPAYPSRPPPPPPPPAAPPGYVVRTPAPMDRGTTELGAGPRYVPVDPREADRGPPQSESGIRILRAY